MASSDPTPHPAEPTPPQPGEAPPAVAPHEGPGPEVSRTDTPAGRADPPGSPVSEAVAVAGGQATDTHEPVAATPDPAAVATSDPTPEAAPDDPSADGGPAPPSASESAPERIAAAAVEATGPMPPPPSEVPDTATAADVTSAPPSASVASPGPAATEPASSDPSTAVSEPAAGAPTAAAPGDGSEVRAAGEGVRVPEPAQPDVASSATVPPTEAPPPTEVASPPPPGSASDHPPAQRRPPKPAQPLQPVPRVPPAPQPHDLSRIAQDLQIRRAQVEAVVQLLDEENTVPFIARYRKERTGGLSEDVVRKIRDRVRQVRELAARKQTMLRNIAVLGRLTQELTQAILAAETPKRLEDLYLPFRPKKKSPGTEAREKGLGPLAEAIWNRDPAVAQLDQVLPGLVDPDKWLLNTDDVLAGVKHILAEMVSDSADVRGPLRNYIWDQGVLTAVRIETLPEGKGKEFEPYFNFREAVKEIPPHRVLAINRGERANVLRVRIDIDLAMANEIARYHLNIADHPHRDLLTGVIADAVERLLVPSLEKEVRRDLTERAQDHATLVFAKNLKSLLLQPPLRGKRVLAIDPGIRSGCKLAALDESGRLLEEAVVYPHGPRGNPAEAKTRIEWLVRKHQIPVIAIGNGTACRETEQLVAGLIADLEHRRLQPMTVAPTHPPAEGSGLPAGPAAGPSPAVVPPTPPGSTPVLPDLPPPTVAAGPTIVSAVVPSIGDGQTLTTPVSLSAPPVEVVGAVPPPEAVTAGTEIVAPAAEATTTPVITGAVPAPPTVPPAPPPTATIQLTDLPEAPPELAYVIVTEAGASDYSTSDYAREEFPELDPTTRAAISIGRRLQDPLAELVKIDPQHIGVGLYQHDVKQKHLRECLEAVIESSVNLVGVDPNTASVPLLRHVSGLNTHLAREIVIYREKHGRFTSRAQLLSVPGLTEKRYVQAAGFLRIADGSEPLDATGIHPESYGLARQILSELGFGPEDLRTPARLDELRARLPSLDPAALAERFGAGEPTVRDILDALARPGRDPRDDLPPPVLKRAVLRIEDIRPGMELKGTVLNVVPFGAFVDIGLKESGLVHISQMANRYIKSPYDVVSVGDVVTVWVLDVKLGDKKISLTMIPPGQERVRGGPWGRSAGEGRPERGRPSPAAGSRPERPGSYAPRGERGRGPGRDPLPRGSERISARTSPPAPGSVSRGPTPTAVPPPTPAGSPASVGGEPTAAAPAATTAPQPPPPPSKPRPAPKPKPLPQLSAEKRSGKAALNTFAELAAFFKQARGEAGAQGAAEAGSSQETPRSGPSPAAEPEPPATT